MPVDHWALADRGMQPVRVTCQSLGSGVVPEVIDTVRLVGGSIQIEPLAHITRPTPSAYAELAMRILWIDFDPGVIGIQREELDALMGPRVLRDGLFGVIFFHRKPAAVLRTSQ